MSVPSLQGAVTHSSGLPAMVRVVFSDTGVRVFRILGVVLLLAGLQTWGFYNHFIPALGSANANLNQLLNEISTNTQMDKVLRELDNFRRVAGDPVLEKEVVQVYERFIKEFLENRVQALGQLEKAVGAFPVPAATLGSESLARVKSGLADVIQIYADHHSKLLVDIDSPPLYLLPTAIFVKSGNPLVHKLRFNHAVYNSIVGDMALANSTFNELKQQVKDKRFAATVHYAQARMQYAAFRNESKFEYFQQAVQNLQQSLRFDADYGLPKLLLEYLLSVQGGASAQSSSTQGEGTNQAEGERGVISTETPNF